MEDLDLLTLLIHAQALIPSVFWMENPLEECPGWRFLLGLWGDLCHPLCCGAIQGGSPSNPGSFQLGAGEVWLDL